MTGFNHYNDCSCGWCVNYGRSRAAITDYNNSFRERDARLLLKQHGANSISGCYVNPNARCPSCGAPVFFYANSTGTRVYFDDLGPPWPKHPCTDSSRRSIPLSDTQTVRPTRRGKGEAKELLSAASAAGLSKFQSFGKRYKDEWTLVVILAVDRRGHENNVKGEFLNSETNEAFRFTYQSETPLFEVGEFISVNGDQISFVDRETLQPVVFTNGSWVKPVTPQPKQAQSAPLSRNSTRLVQRPKPAKASRKNQKENGDNSSKYDMTKAEMTHFDNQKVSLANLFVKLEPVVNTYSKEGIRKPGEVAVRLNAQGHRTASGSKWTPRLVYFLLALMFNDTSKSASIGKSQEKNRQSAAQERKTPSARTPTELTLDEMATSLSRLGRIVRR